ncbi:MAG TPA: hypothetical protein VFS43_43015 [Polyangiaceae bacterium]|nr:hypothetical protein [Polyangiaceae bacterium]
MAGRGAPGRRPGGHLELARAWAGDDPGRALANLDRAEARLAVAGAGVWLERAAALRRAGLSC